MSTVQSADGTSIAYEASGRGPALILVDGALCHRDSGPSRPLAEQLADRFTVYTYDRRGRGESGDAPAYSVEREVEDLAALIDAAGGSAHVYGISSGAVLAAEAAAHGLSIDRLALYEPPFVVDGSRAPAPAGYLPSLRREIAEGRRGDAVRRFMRLVGMPGPMVHLMRLMPAWRKLKAVAHTLAYDAEIMGGTQSGEPLPADRFEDAWTDALVIVGGKSPEWLHRGGEALADALPVARLEVLEGQTHMVKPEALGPMLAGFFARTRATVLA